MTSRTGRRSESRPRTPSTPSSRRACRRSGTVVSRTLAPSDAPPDARRRAPGAGAPAHPSPSRRRRRARHRSGPPARVAAPGSTERTAVGAPARRHRHARPAWVRGAAATRRIVSSMNRVTPTPAVPSIMSAPAPPDDADSSSDGEPGERVLTPDEPRARVRDGHGGILGAHRRCGHPSGSGSVGYAAPRDRRPTSAPSRQHAQRASRRGVALLHEVGPHDRLSVGAGPCRAQGAWRQQAAAPDGPAHRVLQPGPASSCSIPSPGSAARCSARRSPAGRGARSASSSTRAGWPIYAQVVADLRRSATALARGSRTSGRPTRAGRAASIRPAASCGSATRSPSCPTLADGFGRLRRDRPAVQRPAAAHDGRRPARRDARQPAHRLRDGQRLTAGPGQRPGLRDVPRPDGSASSASSSGSCATAATPWSSCATPIRTGATCSLASDLAARADAAGSRPEGRPHLVPGRDATAAVRLPPGVRPQHRPPAHPGLPTRDPRRQARRRLSM